MVVGIVLPPHPDTLKPPMIVKTAWLIHQVGDDNPQARDWSFRSCADRGRHLRRRTRFRRTAGT
jgi:hypothetical protein